MNHPLRRKMRPRRLLGLARLLSHRERQLISMMLLALIVSVEFFENVMFLFSASHVMGGIGADPRGFALAMSTYAVGSLLMIVNQQWLAQRFGYRRYLTVALTLFTIGTLMAASSTDLTQLVIARFVQGFGGGALFTSSRVLIPIMFSPADRPRAQRIFMIGIFGATAMAPAIAAELMDHGVWQDVFYGAVPLSVIAAVGAWRLLPDAEPRERTHQPLLVPLLWFGLAVAALQAALTEARFDMFSHPVRPALIAIAGALLLIGFLHHQWHHHQPLLQLHALRNPVYLTGLSLYFMYYLISYFNSYLFPIYAEHALGLPLSTVGWLDTSAGLMSFVGILAYIRYAKLIKSKKPLMVAGLLIMACAAWRFSSMPPDVTPWDLIPSLAMKGLFAVLFVIPVAGLTYKNLTDNTFAHGYQSKNLMRQVSGSLAPALGAILLQNRQFSVHTSLVDSTGNQPGITMGWLNQVQTALIAHGMDAGSAARVAMAQLTGMLDRQAMLIASEDLYRLIMVVAIAGACIVMAQRRLA
ncbi:MAG TPA: MFS transporter [Burkholderiaceae bacterium]|nr:MFS transporter [Burkholderiaceae bacterium]